MKQKLLAGVVVALAATAALASGVTDAEGDSATTEDVGGKRADSGEYPFMVHLSTGCSGSLYSKQIVLTAARCVDDTGEDTSITATVGAVDLRDPEAVKIKSTYVHVSDEYESHGEDWALIKLATPVPDARTIKLDTTKQYDRGDFDIVGWGDHRQGPGSGGRYLMEAEVAYVTDATCREAYPDLNGHWGMCAGEPDGGDDACPGDSGGPLLRTDADGRRIQVGIVSRVEGCARPDRLGVYAQVSFFYKEIIAAAKAI